MKAKRKAASRGGLFIKNAAVLTATSLLLKAAGMYFRIYVTDIVGAEGMGLYQMIMSVYMLFSGFASSGIVVAVTRMTADEMVCGSARSVRLVLRRCLAASAAMGAFSAAAAAALAEPIGRGWISDPRAVSSVRMMALAFPFMSVSCCLRGYFTARRRVAVPSAAQVTEQSSRIILALISLAKAAPFGVERSCFAIMLADAISEAAGCIYVSAGYLLDRRRLVCPAENTSALTYNVNRKIWDIAAPITASYYLTTLLRTVESILVPDCLTYSEDSRVRALELFGMVKGMALPLILFPSSLLTSFSSLLVPEISEAATLSDKKRVETAIRRTMHITLTLSIIIGGIFAIFPYELGVTVYSEPELKNILLCLAPFMPLMYTESVVVGLLRGLGEQKSSLRYGIIDSAARLLLIAAIVPRLGLNGFMIVMAFSNLLTPLLHIRRLHRVTGIGFEWSKWLIKPLLSAGVSCLAVRLAIKTALSRLPMPGYICIGAAAAVLLYCLMLLLTGGITAEDISNVIPEPILTRAAHLIKRRAYGKIEEENKENKKMSNADGKHFERKPQRLPYSQAARQR